MSNIIVAMDYDDEQAALSFVSQVTPQACKLKVGKHMFTRFGPDFVKGLVQRGFDIFLDLKFHDIPNTVADACRAAADLGVWMVNVHASGGLKMMQAAHEAIQACTHQPLLIAVTVLTSLNNDDLQALGIEEDTKTHALRLAKLSQQAGCDGVVCSAQEAKMLREQCGDEFCLVTPGIRFKGSLKDDQARIVTPEQALSNGANYLVIGRPITQALNPIEVLQRIK